MRMSSTVSTHEITTRTITTQTREKERTRTLLSLSLCVGAIGIHSSLPPTKREREEVSNRSVNERDVLLCVIWIHVERFIHSFNRSSEKNNEKEDLDQIRSVIKEEFLIQGEKRRFGSSNDVWKVNEQTDLSVHRCHVSICVCGWILFLSCRSLLSPLNTKRKRGMTVSCISLRIRTWSN